MQMHDLFDVASGPLLAGFVGLLLGAFFFGGLWWTVRLTLSSGRSALWHVGSQGVRMAVTLFGFYAVGAGHWERLVACLAGFLVARFVANRMTRSWAQRQRMHVRALQEAGHATQP